MQTSLPICLDANGKIGKQNIARVKEWRTETRRRSKSRLKTLFILSK